ncbi:PepSY-associated TM helix domain-containing protein [Erythrobacter rubeus]|uniref:PepSY domain-containing protein n=1 Tax=Erythrobacter rubeus TaxID=2760803 RepID=A0ABR8KP07_9SPHN|nr:PepSY-associated TM helix domain-containing protein [Erythrobacter rubeus]MBD2840980.1 PepSY domain-containing protein [Erythrobacter rubeus]
MITLSQARTKRLLAVHGWSGTILGLVLYVVIVTGAVAVMAMEIGRWSAGGQDAGDALGPGLHERVTAIAQTVKPEYSEDVSIYPNSAGHLIVFFHTHAMNASGVPDDLGQMVEIVPSTGEEIMRREGYGSELFGTDPLSALDHFIIDLHVNLHLPEPWGLYATGILGLVMFLAAGTGLLVHRHLLKDIFVAPRYSGALLHKRDRHVLAGSWSLIFAFVLAFTGSFLSFAGALGLPIVAKTAFGGDQIAMFSTMLGEMPEGDETPTPLGDLDRIVVDSTARAGTVPDFIAISHYGRADAIVTTTHAPVEGSIEAQNLVYSGANGEFLNTKPVLGTVPSAGNVGFNLMSALHYGSFAGLISKFVWVSLGFAMAFVTLSGMRLWVQRRAENRLWRGFGRVITVMGYGLPIALTGAALGFFVGVPTDAMQMTTTLGFIVGCLPPIALGFLARLDEANLARLYRQMLGTLLLLLPVLRMVTMGDGWGIITPIDPVVVMLDLIFGIAGASCLKPLRLWRGRTIEVAQEATVPAE